MTLKQYLTIMLIGTALCLIAFFFVIININPFEDTGMGFTFFYLSIFFTSLGSISMIAFTIHKKLSKNELPLFRYVQKGFRDALLISSIIVILLLLQGKNYLNWWNSGIIFFAFVLYLASKIINKSQIKTQ